MPWETKSKHFQGFEDYIRSKQADSSVTCKRKRCNFKPRTCYIITLKMFWFWGCFWNDGFRGKCQDDGSWQVCVTRWIYLLLVEGDSVSVCHFLPHFEVPGYWADRHDIILRASLVSSVGSMVIPLTGWYWVRIPVGLALHLHVTSSSCV